MPGSGHQWQLTHRCSLVCASRWLLCNFWSISDSFMSPFWGRAVRILRNIKAVQLCAAVVEDGILFLTNQFAYMLLMRKWWLSVGCGWWINLIDTRDTPNRQLPSGLDIRILRVRRMPHYTLRKIFNSLLYQWSFVDHGKTTIQNVFRALSIIFFPKP
jgi:hypothetical protein